MENSLWLVGVHTVVVNVGVIDLMNGASAEEITNGYKSLRHSIRQLNPDVRICFVTMLPILNNKYVAISS